MLEKQEEISENLIINNETSSMLIKSDTNIRFSKHSETMTTTASTTESNNDIYIVFLNNPESNDENESNKIDTSRYRWYTFFPKMLMEQFSRMANAFFLVIAVLQTIKEISYSGGAPLIFLPLSFVILLNGVKDLYEDYKRKKSDKQVNNTNALVFNKDTNDFTLKKWEEIKQGDIIKVRSDEQFPCDLLLLNSSEPNGICYVETKNIDGETNLKFQQANEQLRNILTQENYSLRDFNYVLLTKKPNEYIYKFDGTLYEIDQELNVVDKNNSILVSKKSFLLRGSSLKQTEYIIGVAVYVGEHTKSMMNSPTAKAKKSTVEKIMGKQIVVIFFLQLIISIILAAIHTSLYKQDYKNLREYIYIVEGDAKENTGSHLATIFFTITGTWTLLLTNFVPISLLVTMETIKFFQALVMTWDIDMYSHDRYLPCKVHCSTLNEELGQIKYIFSDKTGTLTKNYMQYKMMSIGEEIYGSFSQSNKGKLSDKYGEITNCDFIDEEEKFIKDKFNDKDGLIKHFMLCLSLCNTVIINEKIFDKDGTIEYNASSPDEKALVCFARSQKYIFKNRAIDNTVTLEIDDADLKYKILNTCDYSSERKRMSVIVYDLQEKEYIIYTKGADSMIASLLADKERRTETFQKTDKYLKDFAVKGLRTLMTGYKVLDENTYLNWNDRYKECLMDVNHSDEDINKLYDEIEKDFKLIGSTAIEDQLQENVDSYIHDFLETGMKVWMLTGDKLDTAKNIAYSCKLFTNDMHLIEIEEHTPEHELRQRLLDILNNDDIYNELYTFGLLISSEELQHIFKDEELLQIFYRVCVVCQSVVCSRVSPKQKAQVVNLIKVTGNAITLAIGDGANDVGMITEANVGVGIQGVEGTQAASAADYAIAEFSYLKKLLFFHGRESYRRNSYVICYNFYKNVVFVSPHIYSGFLNILSGISLYDPVIYQLFNVLYTSISPGYFGIFDYERTREEFMSSPKYYIQGIYNKCFHMKRFWKWLIMAFLEGFIIYYIVYHTYLNGNIDGTTNDYYSMGGIVYAFVVFVANAKIVLNTHNYDFLGGIIMTLQILAFFLTNIFMSMKTFLPNSSMIGSKLLGIFTKCIIDLKFFALLLPVIVIIMKIELFVNKMQVYLGLVKDGDKLLPYKEKYTKGQLIGEYTSNTLPLEMDEIIINDPSPMGGES